MSGRAKGMATSTVGAVAYALAQHTGQPPRATSQTPNGMWAFALACYPILDILLINFLFILLSKTYQFQPSQPEQRTGSNIMIPVCYMTLLWYKLQSGIDPEVVVRRLST